MDFAQQRALPRGQALQAPGLRDRPRVRPRGRRPGSADDREGDQRIGVDERIDRARLVGEPRLLRRCTSWSSISSTASLAAAPVAVDARRAGPRRWRGAARTPSVVPVRWQWVGIGVRRLPASAAAATRIRSAAPQRGGHAASARARSPLRLGHRAAAPAARRCARRPCCCHQVGVGGVAACGQQRCHQRRPVTGAEVQVQILRGAAERTRAAAERSAMIQRPSALPVVHAVITPTHAPAPRRSRRARACRGRAPSLRARA